MLCISILCRSKLPQLHSISIRLKWIHVFMMFSIYLQPKYIYTEYLYPLLTLVSFCINIELVVWFSVETDFKISKNTHRFWFLFSFFFFIRCHILSIVVTFSIHLSGSVPCVQWVFCFFFLFFLLFIYNITHGKCPIPLKL